MRESGSTSEGAAEIAKGDRRERVERLMRRVEELFPGEALRELREDIRRSLDVPQRGEYHNEGMFMDSHLDLILQQVENIAADRFPDQIPESVREAMRRTLARDRASVERYVFLHDISKADCLSITIAGEKQPVTWQEWQAMLQGDADGQRALSGDEEALQRFCEKQGISGVSYMQEREDGTVQHGAEGSEKLREQGIADDAMLTAIDSHEVAYQFSRVNAATYDRYFGEMVLEAKDFALTASFVDTMASLRPDGTSDLSNFLALTASREKAGVAREVLARMLDLEQATVNAAVGELVAGGKGADAAFLELVKTGASGKFEAGKLLRSWQELYNADRELSGAMAAAAEASLREAAKLPRYDLEKLRAACEQLAMDANTISELLDLAAKNPQGVNAFVSGKVEKKIVGKAMKAIKEALT